MLTVEACLQRLSSVSAEPCLGAPHLCCFKQTVHLRRPSRVAVGVRRLYLFAGLWAMISRKRETNSDTDFLLLKTDTMRTRYMERHRVRDTAIRSKILA